MTKPPAEAPLPAETVDGWPKDEIEAARKECDEIIKRHDVIATPEDPIRDGNCGTPAPVRLMAIGTTQQVTFEPPVTVNCRVAAAMADWLKSDLQPLARKHLGSRITVVETMSSYSCRTAYGRVASRLSEHGFANAIDIRGFETAKGQSARLLEDWGVTARDERKRLIAEHKRLLAELQKAAEERAKLAAEAAARKRKTSDLQQLQAGPSQAGGPPADAGNPAKRGNANQADPAPPPPPDLDAVTSPPPKSSAGRFLRAAHEKACARFGTVLGPEVNEAHRNHFHVDLAPRRRSNYCR